MEYFSPLLVFTPLGIKPDDFTADNLDRLEKRVLLEMGFNEKEPLYLDNRQLSKQDVLELFHSLREEGILEIHQQILADKALYQFLKSGVLPKHASTLQYADPRLQELISPYALHHLRKLIKQHFLQRAFLRCITVYNHSDMLTHFDRNALHDNISSLLMTSFDELEHLKAAAFKPFGEQHHYYFDQHFIVFLNTLPADFQFYRNRMALALNDLGAILHEDDITKAYQLYSALKHLKTNSSIREMMERNYHYIHALHGRNRLQLFFVIAGSLIIVFFGLYFINEWLLKTEGDRFSESQEFNLKRHLRFTAFVLQGQSVYPNGIPDTIGFGDLPEMAYLSDYEPLNYYYREGKASLKVSNHSEYDLILFVIGRKANYSLCLAPGKTDQVIIEQNDLIHPYLGKNWLLNDLTAGLNTPYDNRLIKYLPGRFMETDNRTAEVFNHLYKLTGEGLDPIPIRSFRDSSNQYSPRLLDSITTLNELRYYPMTKEPQYNKGQLTFHSTESDSLVSYQPIKID